MMNKRETLLSAPATNDANQIDASPGSKQLTMKNKDREFLDKMQ